MLTRERTIVWALVAFGVAACGTLVPQTPPEEQAGYNAARRVIGAIEKFREDRGRYPAALHDLVPVYFRHARRLDFSTPDGESGKFEYKASGETYTLGFRYFAQGLIQCRTYYSDEMKWHTIVIDP